MSSLVADVSGLGLWGAYTSGRAGGEVALIAEKGFTGLAGFMARGEVGYRSDGSAPYLRIGADLNYLFVGPYVGLTQTFDAYPSTAFSVGLSLSVPASLTKLPVSFAVRAFHESFLYNRAHAADGWVFGAGITWTFR